METSFYSETELSKLGLKSYGNHVCISRKASFYSIQNISIGDNVRIDDFCILSGHIEIGSNIHISSYVALYGSHTIILEDYTGISSRTTIYSAMDDFSGDYLIGPIHKDCQTRVSGGPVIIKRYTQIGAHCIIFPDVTIGEGVVVGAMSLVNKSLDDWGFYVGVPCKFSKKRSRNLLKLL